MAEMMYLQDVVTLELVPERCIGCGMCLDVCPHAVFELKGLKVDIVRRDACIECGACALNCPVEALSVRAGVGCAAAVIKGSLTGTEPSCDCSGDTSCC